ncbi:Ff.00g062830.m01.CDS01 [Fusarium sp. VM40]|nr:Ff.00g062830.m01.CDS01 [Fusarium sp. VM40]
MRSLGSRGTGMLGMSMMGLANFITNFTFTNIGALFAASGVIMGMGISKRGLANGVIFAAGGLGGAAISYGLDALILQVGVPAAYLVKERIPYKCTGFVDRNLFKLPTFLAIFIAGAIATFPLFVPPFFIPLYAKSIGLPSNVGAGLVAGFNFASAVGRICCGLLCDRIGAMNVLFLSLVLTGLSNLVIWSFSTTLAPLIPFVILNGMANGGFFSTMPTVIGSVFGPSQVSVAMGMSVTGWAGGYLMGSPIAGYLLDAYGGAESGFRAYRPAMYYAGSLALAAAGIIAMIRLHISRNILAEL